MNPRIRSENLTRLLYLTEHLQGATYTEANRYPELFNACKLLLHDVPEPRILSFGCSTGEEAFSLAALMPNAQVIGADINHWCLRKCRSANSNPRLHFVHAHSNAFDSLSGLDAIFCMAVFQRTENRTRPAESAHPSFPFARFEQQIAKLDRMLAVGGLFFIDHSDFRFQDTCVAARYAPLEFKGNSIAQERPVFGPDNKLIARQYVQPRGFRKLQS